MEENNVPSHHLQSEFCTTRPAYRQGRELKAVKVYTVNNESKYLLILGVPAVGAGRELIKLCALYGAVEEYRVMDDYPAAERFTEVYWVKFSRIQSARFAKRKLDNHSFFGGVLHVCYAPEYETVEETREKLQGRRRTIAKKTTENETKTSVTSDVSTIENSTPDSQTVSVLPAQGMPVVQTPPSHQPPPPIARPVDQMSGTLTQTEIEPPRLTWQIPPPPQVMYAGGLPDRFQRHRFDHARVPSSHSTLPHGYDPRKHNPGLQQLPPPDQPEMNILQTHVVTGETLELKNKRDINTVEQGPSENNLLRLEGGKATVPKDLIKQNFGENSKSSIIVKDFKKSSGPPKFVPRQAIAAIKSKQQTAIVDKLGQQIRRNAVTLQENIQGPTLPDGTLRSKERLPPEVLSVDRTVQEIRQKVAQFSEAQPVKKKLKPS